MRMSSWSFACTVRVYLFSTALGGILFATGCGTVSSMGTGPISVTITNKITTIAAGAAATTLNATVQNDATNSGVTWTLTVNGSACASLVCGTLSGATTTSVTYTPPSGLPVPPTSAPTITATSMKDSTKSDSDGFTITGPAAVSVTITNKVNTMTAGGAPITLNAVVTGDPTNAGVLWQLNGCNPPVCANGSGTLSAQTPFSVVYTPPAMTSPAPHNSVTIAAGSVHDGTKADFDTIGIISPTMTVSSCAGTPTGHESLLSGQYAFVAQGTSVMAGSFAAHGDGHFTDLGGNVVGNLDINPISPQSITLVGSNAGPGFYTVGIDPAGVGDIGCLLLYGSDGSSRIFRLSLGQVSGGIATAGRITEYDDQTGNAPGVTSRVSGLLLRQDPTAFASGDTRHLQTNYAFGLTGDLVGTQASVAGALVLNAVSGAITNSDFDSVEIGGTSAAQVQHDLQGITGSITSVSALTGRALFSLTTNGSWPTGNIQTQAAIYIVNAHEFFLVSLDVPVPANPAAIFPWLYTGRAIVSGSAFNANSPSGNNIFHATGLTQVNSAFSPQVNLGLLDFSGGNLTGKIFGYDTTACGTIITITNESYAVSSTFGRVTLTGTGLTNPPVLYLAAPTTDTEPIQAFAAGTDSTGTSATFGLLEPGATTNIATASLSGSYFFGDESTSFDGTPVNQAGVIGIAGAGVLSGTQFSSSAAPTLLTETGVSGSIAIDNANGPGTGNVGANSVAIANGSKIFFIKEAAGTPASISVAEHQ
jgi:hypothetical protein